MWQQIIVFIALLSISIMAQAQTEFEMRPRPTDEKEFPEYIQYLVDVAEPRTTNERAADADAKTKFGKALIADSLFVGGPGFPAGFSDEQYEEAVQHSIDNQFDFLSATISNGPPEDTPDVVLTKLKLLSKLAARARER